ncbi:MAG TPA: SIMPL domain-containing protein [Gammaproteobacteria bacterium]|nr:SIMPL domain-containing protein [Gammaproteobacteria bacterium]
MRLILTCGLLALMALAMPAARAAEQPSAPHVVVTGQGHVEVVPDVFRIQLSVEQRDKNIEKAKQAVDAASARAIGVARSFSIAKRDITSTRIFIAPQYDYSNKQRRLIDYEVRRQITLVLRDIDKYDRLLDALVKAGVTGIDGVSASYSKPQSLTDQAFTRAVAAAKAKAKHLADAFGARLGAVYSIVEQSSPLPGPRPLAMSKASYAGAASEPGTIDVEASIRATFLLKPR